MVVGVVGAGWLLFGLLRVLFSLNYLVLLATVRGGTSFLCQTATKKRSKENALQPLILKRPERAVLNCLGLQKNGWRHNPEQLKPSRFVNRYPHASPPVWVAAN